jgi:hypothetical protein
MRYHRLAFFSLTSLYAACFTLPGAMAWTFLFSGSAMGQTIRDPQQESINYQLIEAARQRLIQRNELPNAKTTLTLTA